MLIKRMVFPLETDDSLAKTSLVCSIARELGVMDDELLIEAIEIIKHPVGKDDRTKRYTGRLDFKSLKKAGFVCNKDTQTIMDAMKKLIGKCQSDSRIRNDG